MIKKFIFLLISGVFCVSFFAGCSNGLETGVPVTQNQTTEAGALDSEALIFEKRSKIIGPDLIISEFKVISWTSTSFVYSFTVENIGNLSADLDGPTSSEYDNVSVQSYLSADDVFQNSGDIPSGGSILGLSPLGILEPGESKTYTNSGGSKSINPLERPYLTIKIDWGNSIAESNESNNTSAALFPLPDLVLENLTVLNWSSTSITYTYRVKNIGSYPANLDGPTASEPDNVSVQSYLSADTIFGNSGDIASGGTILGLSPLGYLNPGESRTYTNSGGTASLNPLATPYLTLKVDWGSSVLESNEANNTDAALIPLPDLVLENLTVLNWSSTSITYTYRVKNIGSYPANLDGATANEADNVSVQSYLSADTIFGNSGDIASGGTILGLSPLGYLNPGESRTYTNSGGTASLNPLATPYLTLKVDWGSSVLESNEANNTAAALIPLPDLVLENLTVLNWSSTSITYTYRVKNIGSYPANLDGPTASEPDNVSVQSYLSADTIFGNSGDIASGGTILGLSPLGYLNPGESRTYTNSGGTASLNPLMTPYLTLKVDWGSSVLESNEANNTAAALIPLPDLVLENLTVLNWSSTSITYTYRVKNIGSYPANLDGPTASEPDNVSVQSYLSADTIFGNSGDIASGGTILGLSPLGYLNPGESRTYTNSGGTASLNPLATPYLTLKVDWGSSVLESNEANNTAAALIPLPDLVIDALTVTGWDGYTITYSYTIKNIGTLPANLDGPTSSSYDNVSIQGYASSDTVFGNAGDIPFGGTILGLSPLGFLNPGETRTFSFSASAFINTELTPYLTVKIDWGNSVTEIDEANNTAAAQIGGLTE